MDIKLNDIQRCITIAYGIDDIKSVERFTVVASKFTTQDHHFLVKTSKNTFFLKRYDTSHINKILCEVSAVLRLKDRIRIPQIFQTKEKLDYFIDNGSVFVLYQYVDVLNLKETDEEAQSFFDVLCDIETKLTASNSDWNNFYDFHLHLSRFESESTELLKVIASDGRNHAPRDLEYVKFLVNEVNKLKSDILNLKIPKSLIHGDFLMQNLLRDEDGIVWVLDWEKSLEYITSVDVMRSITFTMFDPAQEDMNLNAEVFAKWSRYCFKKIPLSKEEKSNAINLYYFHVITNTDFLRRLYIERQDLNEKMAGEDFLICKWFRDHKDAIQVVAGSIL
ncbi:MAG: phosphotransferase [bacterium]|nr:phosphotransferase [bacterium]